jgi:predicted glycosyltransferase
VHLRFASYSQKLHWKHMKCSVQLLLTAAQQIECQSYLHTLGMEMKSVSKTLVDFSKLLLLSAPEVFIEFCHCRSFKIKSMPSHSIQKYTTLRAKTRILQIKLCINTSAYLNLKDVCLEPLLCHTKQCSWC